jgi:putative component of membrane protein insertase Oxa1/YidC/SpoIIIJ protein YidD
MTYSARENHITCKAILWMAKVQALQHFSWSSFISNLITKRCKFIPTQLIRYQHHKIKNKTTLNIKVP